ncbi:hypothetical protein [Streptomyces sp. G-G2]|uniref:hypothetical protein n=1 Tax=Streptomyces sp. G-G2 TaxID=3046201 RepID=UPI0024BB42D7|nr:hypothetical protein [Streptomyces sp. G-G2]MDJ0386170.1 hypothetical protein [Streptomyces sp. G-G2]
MDAIQSRLEHVAHGLARECLAILPGGALSEASLEASRPLDRRALSRGIEMRSVHQDSTRNDPATLAYARWLTERGGQVRTSPLLPPRLLVFDRAVAVVPIDPQNSRLGAPVYQRPRERRVAGQPVRADLGVRRPPRGGPAAVLRRTPHRGRAGTAEAPGLRDDR